MRARQLAYLVGSGCFGLGCENSCTTPSRTTAVTSTPSALPAVPASARADAFADEAFPTPAVRDALLAWRGARSAAQGHRAALAHRVEFVDKRGSGHVVVVGEDREPSAQCAATLWAVLVPWAYAASELYGGPNALTQKRLGPDCCAGQRCDHRPAMGWMIRLLKSAAHRDIMALRELIDPTDGVRVVVVCSGDGCAVGGEGEETKQLRRGDANLKEALEAVGVSLEGDELSCEESAPDRFACAAHGGGYDGQFDWKRDGDRAFVVRIRAHGH